MVFARLVQALSGESHQVHVACASVSSGDKTLVGILVEIEKTGDVGFLSVWKSEGYGNRKLFHLDSGRVVVQHKLDAVVFGGIRDGERHVHHLFFKGPVGVGEIARHADRLHVFVGVVAACDEDGKGKKQNGNEWKMLESCVFHLYKQMITNLD